MGKYYKGNAIVHYNSKAVPNKGKFHFSSILVVIQDRRAIIRLAFLKNITLHDDVHGAGRVIAGLVGGLVVDLRRLPDRETAVDKVPVGHYLRRPKRQNCFCPN